MCDVTGDPAALELLRVQRNRLADRLQPPWWCLLQWGLARATGIKVGPRPLRVLRDGLFYYRPGGPALIAMLVVNLAVGEAEFTLIRHGRLAAAIVVATLAVVTQVALQQAWLDGTRQELLNDGGAA